MKNTMFFVFLLVFASFASSYADLVLEINVTIDANGSAFVIEKNIFLLENNEEIQNFESYLLRDGLTLIDWQRFSKNIHYHFAGAITGLHIVATREFNYGYTAAAVSMEYNIENLFVCNKINERTTSCALDNRKLDFESNEGFQLNSGQSVSLELPKEASNIKIAPRGGVIEEKYNEFSWRGPLVGRWDVSFETEKSLSQEVTEFFIGAYKSASESYLWLVVLAFLLIGAFKYKQLREMV